MAADATAFSPARLDVLHVPLLAAPDHLAAPAVDAETALRNPRGFPSMPLRQDSSADIRTRLGVGTQDSGTGVTPIPRLVTSRRPAPLLPLYASFVTLQAADVATTFRALNAGAVEANPVMGGIVNNRAAFVALKAGMTTATVLMGERLWKRNRVAAVAMMAALNSAYALVVAHNARVVASLPGR